MSTGQGDMEQRVRRQENDVHDIYGLLTVIDGRLDGIDRRLTGIDGRLDGMDERFVGVEGQLGEILEILRRP